MQEHNYLNNAEEEKENIKDTVLESGIVYCHYAWHSENSENTCDECRALDGQEFDYYDEVPERHIQIANVMLRL